MFKKLFFIILFIVTLSGCATTYYSHGEKQAGQIELTAASESEVLSAAFEAITRKFPAANINQLSGYQVGFSWFHMPLLDRTDFKFILTKRKGLTVDGLEVTGYSYSVLTQGTQFFVDTRYVQPLIKEFKKVLEERGIQNILITKLIHSRNSRTDYRGKSRKSLSTGTGFFITENGYLITNYHVIEGASEISIATHDKKVVGATLIQSDPVNDVALLKADVSSIPLNIVSSNTLEKAKQVFTLGYPLVGIQGQEQKATFGRVNALSGVKGDIRFIQVDIPVQPGNSGGPLIDKNGNVVGVITAMLDQINTLRATGVLPQNVNYAVKSDYIMPLLTSNVNVTFNVSSDDSSQELSILVKNSEKSVVLVMAE